MPEKRIYTHEERRTFVQQAAADYYAGETGGPAPLDRSFMEPNSRQNSKHRHIKRISAVAAAAVLLIFAGSTLSMALFGQDVAYGDKGLLHRLYKSTMGLETDKQDEDLLKENTATLEITDVNDVVDAADFLEGKLYMPAYLPEGFSLEKMILKKTGDGSMSANSTFKAGDRTVKIAEWLTIDKDISQIISAPAEVEPIHWNNLEIFVAPKTAGGKAGEVSVTVIAKEASCMITGSGISREEGIEIAKSMRLYRQK